MAYLTVTTQADVVDAGDGKLSLREAVAQANAQRVRRHHPLHRRARGQDAGADRRRARGDPGPDDRWRQTTTVTIDGNLNGRILNIVGAGTDVRLRQVTLAHGLVGDEENGGAILLGGGSLAVSTSTIRDSRTERNGY